MITAGRLEDVRAARRPATQAATFRPGGGRTRMEVKVVDRILALGLTVALLAGCAGTPRLSDEERLARYQAYAGEPVDRFTQLRIDNWESLDSNKLVLWNGRQEAYLLTVWDTCADLRQAQTITVISNSSHTVSVFDKIKVLKDPRFGPMMTGFDTCPIREIRPINVKQLRADDEAAKKQRAAAER